MNNEKTQYANARNGLFSEEYGKEYFEKVSEAFDIGRVKVTIVPIGQKGKNAADFYLTVEQMMDLCEEIRNGVFEKKIAADNGPYPGAYQYTTGENGSKHLNIGGGKFGVRMQIRDTENNKNYTLAVTTTAFKEMARDFYVFSGLQPVMPGSYFEELVKAFSEGRKEREKYRSSLSDADSLRSRVIEEPAEREPVSQDEQDKANQESFMMSVHGPITECGSYYCFPAVYMGSDVTLCIKKELTPAIKYYDKFVERVESVGINQVNIIGEISKNEKGTFIKFGGFA